MLEVSFIIVLKNLSIFYQKHIEPAKPSRECVTYVNGEIQVCGTYAN